MKQTKRTLSICALLVTLFLFVQCKNQATNKSGEASAISESNPECLPLAYVEVDSLLAHFDFYNYLASDLEDKVVKYHSSINAGYQKLQNEVINYEKRMQSNAFLNQERIIQEQTRIQRMKDDLEKKAAQGEQELTLANQLLERQISDTLSLGMKEFNTPQKYFMIFAKSGNSILYADARHNITDEVIEFLNKRFKVQ